MKYRGFKIEKVGRWDFWSFVHPEYDGPRSPLCGIGRSVEDCQEQIDELLEELPEYEEES